MPKDENGIILLVAISAVGLAVGFVATLFEVVDALVGSKSLSLLITSTVVFIISLLAYRLTEGRFPWRRSKRTNR